MPSLKKLSPWLWAAASALTVVAALFVFVEIPVYAAGKAPFQSSPVNPWLGLLFGAPTTLLGGLLFFMGRKQMKRSTQLNLQPEVSQPWTKTKEMPASRAQILAVSNVGAEVNSPDMLLDFVETLVAPGRRVLIVDCESGGVLTESVGLTGKAGFSDYLAEEPDHRYFTMPVWNSNREGIFIMPAGTHPHHIAALLSKPNASQALALLREEFDHAVINAPAILTAGAMRDLTPLANGVVLITPAERSTSLAADAVRQVQEYGGQVLALVDERAPQFEATA